MSSRIVKSSRIVHHEDALPWLAAHRPCAGASLVSSLPDWSEFPALSLEAWKGWFVAAARAMLRSTPPEGVTIFYQRDGKRDGCWVDKAYLCQKAAELEGDALLWHKVVARVPPGITSFGRPGYSHLLCFSKEVRLEIARATADLLPEAGESSWTRGMGVKACRAACELVLTQTRTRTIVDPFCGHGTVLAVANAMGLDAVGVELGRKRAEKARRLKLAPDGSLLTS